MWMRVLRKTHAGGGSRCSGALEASHTYRMYGGCPFTNEVRLRIGDTTTGQVVVGSKEQPARSWRIWYGSLRPEKNAPATSGRCCARRPRMTG
jgi:hypothetical protein